MCKQNEHFEVSCIELHCYLILFDHQVGMEFSIMTVKCTDINDGFITMMVAIY